MFRDMRGAKLSKRLIKVYLQIEKINGGAELEKPIINAHIDKVPIEERTHTISTNGKGYRQYKEIFGEFQEREIDEWFLKVTGITKSIPVQEEIVVSPTAEIVPLSFSIIKGVSKIHKLKLRDNWLMQDIFGSSIELMEHLFPSIDGYSLMHNVPKSWSFDYATGKLEIPLKATDLINIEALSLISTEYVDSLFSAMVRKRNKNQRWKSLCKYFYHQLPFIVTKDPSNPKMFCL